MKKIKLIIIVFLVLLFGEWRNGSQPLFFTSDGASINFAGIPAVYAGDTNTTWFCWEGWELVSGTAQRINECATLNHSTGIWTGNYIAGTRTLVGDLHGAPSICRDPTYKHVYDFYGAHNDDPTRISYTVNPDDPSSWNDTGTLATAIYGPQTFPDCFISGSTLYLMYATGSNTTTDLQSQLAITKATINLDGSLTWTGIVQVLFSFGSGSWMLQDNTAIPMPDGSGIAFVISYKSVFNSPPTQNQYIGIYRFSDGAVLNVNGSTIIASSSQPINLTAANADFIVVTEAQTYLGLIAIDNSGFFHLVYSDTSSPRKLYEINNTSGSWSLPFTLFTYPVTVNDTVAGTPVINSNGDLDVYYSDGTGNGSGQYAGSNGNVWKRTRTAANGTWGSPQLIFGSTAYSLTGPCPIVFGSRYARVIFGEGSSDNVTIAGNLRGYAYGDNGFLKRPWPWSVLNPQ